MPVLETVDASTRLNSKVLTTKLELKFSIRRFAASTALMISSSNAYCSKFQRLPVKGSGKCFQNLVCDNAYAVKTGTKLYNKVSAPLWTQMFGRAESRCCHLREEVNTRPWAIMP